MNHKCYFHYLAQNRTTLILLSLSKNYIYQSHYKKGKYKIDIKIDLLIDE